MLGRLFRNLRRDLARGFDASYHDYKTLSRIVEWQWPFWSEKGLDVPVHMLVGAEDWEWVGWTLASLHAYTETSWPVVIHDDGTLPPVGVDTLKLMFPDVKIIARGDSDAAMTRLLTPYPACADYRRSAPLALKVLDIPQLSKTKRFIILDKSVLFFATPTELLGWAKDEERDECWFIQNPEEPCAVTAAEASKDFGIKLWPRLGTGICLLTREAMDLSFCEQVLANSPILSRDPAKVEQSLFALCAAKFGRGGLLPPRYEVSTARTANSVSVARQYIAPVRERFYAEGIARLEGPLLIDDGD